MFRHVGEAKRAKRLFVRQFSSLALIALETTRHTVRASVTPATAQRDDVIDRPGHGKGRQTIIEIRRKIYVAPETVTRARTGVGGRTLELRLLDRL